MKLSKDELIKKVNEKVMDEDVKVELMEDITDSFEVSEEPKEDERVKELEEKYSTLLEKYKERFLNGSEKETEEKDEDEDEDEELKEEEYVDVKEI